MKQSETLSQYRARVRKVHGSKISVISYTSIDAPVTYQCTKCSHEWTTRRGGNVVNLGSGCPRCAAARRAQCRLKVFVISEYKRQLRKLTGGTITTSACADIVGSGTKVPHTCSVCGHTWNVSATAMLGGRLCASKQCKYKRIAEKSTRSTEKFCADLYETHGDKIKLVGQYRVGRKLRFKCYTCLNTWKAVASNVQHGSGCPYCAQKLRNHRSAKIKHVTADGIALRMQGYEPMALQWILDRFPKLRVTDIVFDTSGNVPTVRYRIGRRNRTYYPDMFVPSQNRLIEVKSTYTLGLSTGKNWRRNQEKAKACQDQGYKFTLMLMHQNGDRMWLPKDWYLLSRKEVLILMAYRRGRKNANCTEEPIFLNEATQ